MRLLTSEWNVLLMAAVWIVTALLEAVFPEHFENGRLAHRLEPVFPIALCVFCAVAIPGPWMPPNALLGQRVVLGIVLGAGSHSFISVAKRFGLTPFLASLMKKKKKRGPREGEGAPRERA